MKSFSLLLGFFLIYVLFGFYILIGVGLTYILFDFYIMLKQIPKQKQQPITIKELFNNFITGFKDFYEKLKLVLIILSILIGFIIFILLLIFTLPFGGPIVISPAAAVLAAGGGAWIATQSGAERTVWQLDPAKCQPTLIDYNWHGTTARPCGAAYRPQFMVTIDIPGYENLFINEVRQYSRIGFSETIASIGTELMYRRRTVEDPRLQLQVLPGTTVPVEVPDEPILSAGPNEIRLHAMTARKGRKLDWTDAAKYFQTALTADKKCEPRYDDAVIYKIVLAHYHHPYMSFEEALDHIRKVHYLTDGMKQVCYFAYFQAEGGETGYPDMWPIYPPSSPRARGFREVPTDYRSPTTDY